MLFMTRLFLLLIVVLLAAGCSPKTASSFSMPASVAEWERASDSTSAALAPKALGAWTARYAGTPEITVVVNEMPATTLAFDSLQSWRPTSGKLAFYRGRYFGIAESRGADQRTLSRFVTAFEKSLGDLK